MSSWDSLSEESCTEQTPKKVTREPCGESLRERTRGAERARVRSRYSEAAAEFVVDDLVENAENKALGTTKLSIVGRREAAGPRQLHMRQFATAASSIAKVMEAWHSA